MLKNMSLLMLLSVSQVHRLSCTLDTNQENISPSVDLANNYPVGEIPEHVLVKEKLYAKCRNAEGGHYDRTVDGENFLDKNKQVSFNFFWDNECGAIISSYAYFPPLGKPPLIRNQSPIRFFKIYISYSSFLKWDLELLELVVSNKADINIQSFPKGKTLLMEFVLHNKFEHVKYLLSLENIDISLKNKQGQTALDIAVTNDNQEIIELFQNYFETQATKTSK